MGEPIEGAKELLEMKDAVQKMIAALKKTTELFYTQHEEEGYRAFSELLDPLMKMVENIFMLRLSKGVPEFNDEELVRILTEATSAMEVKDSVLLADILQYDFLDQLVQIETQL